MLETYHLSPMQGMRRLQLALLAAWLCLALAAIGCGTTASKQAQPTTSVTTEAQSPTAPRRSVACRLHSCAPPYYCNDDSGVCELLPCSEKRKCPYGYKCDPDLNVCR